MKRFIVISLCLLAFCAQAFCHEADSEMDRLLDRYFAALMLKPDSVKTAELDWVIESCTDSSLRSEVAAKVFRHYRDSPLMGEESVAIHIWDRWYSDGTVLFADEAEMYDAAVFATFNRRSLLYMPAPQVSLHDRTGSLRTIPSKGVLNVIFFYDTSCPKCKALSILLPHVMEDYGSEAVLYTVYTGTDREQWDGFTKDFKVINPKIRVEHLWDPEALGEYQMAYGVTTTPRLFAVSPSGIIIGRRLEAESLKELLLVISGNFDYICQTVQHCQ